MASKTKDPPAAIAPANAGQGRKLRPRAVTPDYVAGLKAYAEVLYLGGLKPKSVSRAESVAALIEIGRDVGLPATMAVTWIAIINGRPSIWGDGAMALVRSSGLLESIREGFEGEPGTDGYTAWVELKRVGAAEPRVSRFSLADARAAKLLEKVGPWQEYRDRMLMWRAKGFGVRDEFPDVLCGLIFAEEANDMPRVVVATAGPGVDPDPTPPAAPPVVELTAGRMPTVEVRQLSAIRETCNALPPGPPAPVETTTADKVAAITDTQTEEAARLRKLFQTRTGHRPGTEDGGAAWAEFVKEKTGENVRSLKHFSEVQAAAFLKAIGAELDPAAYQADDAEQSVPVAITEGQLDEVARLRAMFLVGKGIHDADSTEAAAAWSEFVFTNTAPRSVRKASRLTAPRADRFIVTIGEQLDPFTYPKKPPAG